MNSVFSDLVAQIEEESVIISNYLECGGPKDYDDYKGAVGRIEAFRTSIEIIKEMQRKLEAD